MRTLQNGQYKQFILNQVVRPYSPSLTRCEELRKEGKISGENYWMRWTIHRIVFNPSDEMSSYLYWDLIKETEINPGWFKGVVDRLIELYDRMDFSFFPNEPFANLLKSELIKRGIVDYSPFVQKVT